MGRVTPLLPRLCFPYGRCDGSLVEIINVFPPTPDYVPSWGQQHFIVTAYTIRQNTASPSWVIRHFARVTSMPVESLSPWSSVFASAIAKATLRTQSHKLTKFEFIIWPQAPSTSGVHSVVQGVLTICRSAQQPQQYICKTQRPKFHSKCFWNDSSWRFFRPHYTQALGPFL